MFFLGNDVKDNLPGRGVTVDGLNHYSPYFVLTGEGFDPDTFFKATIFTRDDLAALRALHDQKPCQGASVYASIYLEGGKHNMPPQ